MTNPSTSAATDLMSPEDRLEADRLAAAKAAQVEADRLATEQAKADRLAAAKAAQERATEAERVVAESAAAAEKARLAA
ncbi:hypothetical protein PR202_gb03383 [Eleusine coracana subsp. coracana]|uniref:Uncharacterized protein n=1 Tax=Eleusine coracana subsp. coracana TaxID=191504 RepID=A0AAV5E1W1_ELECO|nr:hypothetical protein PR202_gb03383 [Eleusine coracana subsp. coracana]